MEERRRGEEEGKWKKGMRIRGCRREIGTRNESSKTKENEEEDIEEKEK